MINDPIADLLTRIRNSNQRKHRKVSVPYSKMKHEIVKILLEQGYISNFEIEKVENSKVKKDLVIILKYKNNTRVISGLKRISKPSLRVYANAEELPVVLNGFGIAIISTSKGLMISKMAREKNLGGEVLAFVW